MKVDKLTLGRIFDRTERLEAPLFQRPITENDFRQMVERIQKQTNTVVRPEPQPTWIISTAYDEGTASPFMARLFLGVLKIREQLYRSDRKKRDDFDRAYESVLTNLHSARAAGKEICDLVQNHRSEISRGIGVIRSRCAKRSYRF